MNRLQVLLCSALVCCAAGVSSGVSTSYAATTDELLTGRLLTVTGNPADGVDVTVSELITEAPPSNSPLSFGDQVLRPVGSGTTDPDGYFTVNAEAIDPTTTYEVSADVGGIPVIYDFAPTQSPFGSESSRETGSDPISQPHAVVLQAGQGPLTTTSGEPRVIGPNPPAALAAAAATAETEDSTAVAPRGFKPKRDYGGNDSEEEIDYVGSDFTVVDPPDALIAPSATCGTYRWVPTNQHKYVDVPFRAVSTAYHSTQIVTYHTAKATKVGVALEGSDGTQSGGTAFGVEASSSQTNTWYPGNQNLSTKLVTWLYSRFRKYCLVPHTHQLYPVNNWKWAGVDASGGSRSVARIPGITCPIAQKIGSATTFDGTTTVSWSGWYSVAGVTLNSSQTQTSAVSVRVVPDPGEVKPVYCGSSRVFDTAARLKERQ